MDNPVSFPTPTVPDLRVREAARRKAAREHKVDRIGWLRAAVLGANDGVVSTASLVLGVAAASASESAILLAGISALVAGAGSMAAGEYVSVSSQADSERAEIEQERADLERCPAVEEEELAQLLHRRGLSMDLAREAARQMSAQDALQAHVQEDLGITQVSQANPLQAAAASALSFVTGAAVPVLAAALLPHAAIGWGVAFASLLFLVVLGAVGAYAGGAPLGKATVRVVFWGALAMAFTAAVGKMFEGLGG